MKKTDNTTEKIEFDKERSGNARCVAGIDEVRRGPLAGPVVCAAVILPEDGDIIKGINDSKKLSEKKREELDKLIREKAIAVSVARVEPDEIDEINILRATEKCMKLAAEGLNEKPDVVLVDALVPDLPYKTIGIIKGDAKSYAIGAASIVAKVYRDNLMREYDKIYPEYGFEKNKGYGTKEHIDALKENGYCRIHRKTFIKNFSVEKERQPF